MKPVEVNIKNAALKEQFRNEVMDLARKYENIEEQAEMEQKNYIPKIAVNSCDGAITDDQIDDIQNLNITASCDMPTEEYFGQHKALVEVVKRVPAIDEVRDTADSAVAVYNMLINAVATNKDANVVDKAKNAVKKGTVTMCRKVYEMGYMEGVLDTIQNVEHYGGQVPEPFKKL